LIARFYWEVARQKLPPDVEQQLYNTGPVDPCRALYDRVFAPIIAAIGSSPGTDGVPHLIMAQDGALCQLPFGALLSPEQRFVIEDYLISYITVGRDVVQFDAPVVASGGAVIVADPDYDLCLQTPEDATTPPEERDDALLSRRTATTPQWRTSLERFLPLAGARAEGEAVSRLLRNAGVKITGEWVGRDALEGPLKVLQKPVILHLATHGFFLPDPATQLRDPGTQHRGIWGGLLGDIGQFVGTYGMAHNPLLCSGLVFAGVNTVLEGTRHVPPEAEDGVLTALDVLTMDMHGTELVTLSACQTGQGGILYGEGVVGLRRAFTLVGARTLVLRGCKKLTSRF
jgi:CHAT domain-containing protein